MFGFFFFKQKTAYEMRISDWSSDVCSSDLQPGPPHLRCSFRCQIEAKVSILIHRDLALRQIDTMTPQQSLSPCKALIVHDAGKPLVPSAIGAAGGLDRTSVVLGKRVTVRVDLVGGRILTKNTNTKKTKH